MDPGEVYQTVRRRRCVGAQRGEPFRRLFQPEQGLITQSIPGLIREPRLILDPLRERSVRIRERSFQPLQQMRQRVGSNLLNGLSCVSSRHGFGIGVDGVIQPVAEGSTLIGRFIP